MHDAPVHPSQKRVSCEVCRKHKARCQRVLPSDLKCSRCTLLGVECTTGQQKKIGRPRRRMASPNPEASQNRRSTSPEKSSVGHQTTSAVEHTHKKPKTLSSSPGPESLKGSCNVDWDDLLSPGTASTTPTYTPVIEGNNIGTAAWPTFELDPFAQDPFLGAGLGDFGGNSYMFDPNLDFDINPSSSYSIQTVATMSSPAENPCTNPSSALVLAASEHKDTDDIAISEAIAKFSQMNLDLHVRVSAAESNKANLDFNGLIYQDSPLYIDNITLADFILRTSHEVHLTLTRLRGVRTYRGLLEAPPKTDTILAGVMPLSPQSSPDETYYYSTASSPSPYPAAAQEPLLPPLALTITSIYTQLITLYELILEHLATRIERIGTEPIAPVPGLTVGGMPLVKPCAQGLLFAEVIIKILERLEKSLGIGELAEGDSPGLLSARQISVLWSELDEGSGVMPGQGMLRPAQLRKSFERVAAIFKHLSAEL